MSHAGKRVLVTAAGQGIGRATALAFHRAGAEVIATDINAAALDSLEGLHTRVLDVTDAAAVTALVADLGSLDVLFNCAGYVHAGSILDCDEDAWRFSFELNATAMYLMIRAVLPGMLAQGGGCIINMASIASSLKGVANRCAYGASKAAVIGLTKSVAADYVGQGIRCNAICPGTVDSPSLHQRVADQAAREGRSEAEVQAAFAARQPMGRVGRPEEIAALALYLASDAAAFVTGTAQVIDGGWSV
ncbi:SDR family oxidoreductase [Pseudomonas oryzihabitans]|uniref:SDR family oxidoreductase n=1 Tax=Pseudomonas oryzihabitans TaxID=47885 RepID=UPI001F51838B|nr:SDR family oxidoreductase [Pseudomonas oryzihabitans]MCI1008645.1 SDR family oxidoreductase [Pseudomonas oryzihabitans]